MCGSHVCNRILGKLLFEFPLFLFGLCRFALRAMICGEFLCIFYILFFAKFSVVFWGRTRLTQPGRAVLSYHGNKHSCCGKEINMASVRSVCFFFGGDL